MDTDLYLCAEGKRKTVIAFSDREVYAEENSCWTLSRSFISASEQSRNTNISTMKAFKEV